MSTLSAPKIAALEDSASGHALALLKDGEPVFENFVDFTTGLVTNVIEVVVGATLDQLEAYSDLVANVSGSLENYEQRTFPNLEADNGDVIQYINGFIKNTYGTETWTDVEKGNLSDTTEVALKPEKLSDFLAHFGGVISNDQGIADVINTASSAISEKNLYDFTLAKFKKQMKASYDQLATILKLGMQKLVITNGRIATSLVFKSSGRDNATAESKKETSSELNATFNFGGTLVKKLINRTTTAKLSVGADYKQSNLSVLTERRTASTSVDIAITGGVELSFRTESFPSIDPTTPP